MPKLNIIKFWVIAFSVIIRETLKGNNWNMIYADFHLGDTEDGRPIRKQLIAKRSVGSFDLYWQDLSVWRDAEQKD